MSDNPTEEPVIGQFGYYPEHAKLRLVKEQSQTIREFLDWLSEDGIDMCKLSHGSSFNTYKPTYETIEKVLARYFEIDLNKIEEEKRTMLAVLRASHGDPEGDDSPPPAKPNAGVTLVELLITLAIIAIITAATLGVASQAIELARRSDTEATIRRLQTMMDEKLDYSVKRIPLRGGLANTPENRLNGLRELIRYELPDRWTDLTQPPEYLVKLPKPFRGRGEYFHRRITAKTSPRNQGAELLYLILTLDAEDKELTRAKDVADTDQDGHPEFIDGWGNPISWLRWPSGYPFREYAPDPNDPYRIDPDARLVRPLIYSPGPDKEGGINCYADETVVDLDPFTGEEPEANGELPGTITNQESLTDNVTSH